MAISACNETAEYPVITGYCIGSYYRYYNGVTGGLRMNPEKKLLLARIELAAFP